MKNLNLKAKGLKLSLILCSLFFLKTTNSQSIPINQYKQKGEKITYPFINDDLSGITYSNKTKTLFMVQNDPPNIYEVDLAGNFIRKIKLTGFDDTEGISHIAETQFAIAEEKKGRIVFFDILSNTSEINLQENYAIQLPNPENDSWGLNDGLEGVSYNPSDQKIYTVKEKDNKGFFAFDLPDRFPSNLTNADIIIPCDVNSAGFPFLKDLAGVYHQGNSILMLSEDNKVLVQIDENCNEISRLSLAAMEQPEGITISDEGFLYVAGEKNELFIFEPPSCRYTDSLALTNIYQSLNGNFWNLSNPITTWEGVSLNENGCVDMLRLSDKGLSGRLPSSIGDLREVVFIEMANNAITGSIPKEIGQLNKLSYLAFTGNDIDALPTAIGDLSNLTVLEISNNRITELPASLGKLSKLISFVASNNQIKNIPESIGDLNNLKGLVLQNNQLDELPTSLSNLSNLILLKIQSNQFNGCYNDYFSQLCFQLPRYTSFNQFISEGNNFDATWEDFCAYGFGGCDLIEQPCRQTDSIALATIFQSLNYRYVHNLEKPVNQWPGVRLNENGCVDRLDLSEKSLTGEIPAAIGDLAEVTFIKMVENSITGQIPEAIGNLENLKILSLGDNEMSGPIPESIGRLTNLDGLYLSSNRFTELPAGIGNLEQLTNLYLGGNQLSGCYPDEFNQLCNRLSSNSNRNFAISSGNNFDISWEEFCAGATCTLNKQPQQQDFESNNYPNPFSTQTTIIYNLLEEDEITLSIYDAKGKQVAQLLNNEKQQAGKHTSIFESTNLPSGVYYYHIQSSTKNEVNKIMLIK